MRLRRVARLLEGGYDEHAQEAFRDVDGRYIVVVQFDNGELWFKAKRPVATHSASATPVAARPRVCADPHGMRRRAGRPRSGDSGAAGTSPRRCRRVEGRAVVRAF